MNTLRSIDKKAYGKLLAEALPTVVASESDYRRTLAKVENLMERDEDNLTPEEVKLLDLLVTLVDRYESEHYPIDRSTPHEILIHLMESRGMTHKDVWELFGSRGVASEVLNRKRSISKSQARALADFFHVSADLFIGNESSIRKAG
jgi:HTH-type transcriptional regulator/antitoxin HigA